MYPDEGSLSNEVFEKTMTYFNPTFFTIETSRTEGWEDQDLNLPRVTNLTSILVFMNKYMIIRELI
jgi:hypothetical protein